MKSLFSRQRVPIGAIRIVDPARETRFALLFASGYIAAAVVTGLVERAWPMPLWGATLLTSDATYALAFKIGLLLVVPSIAIARAGYTVNDLLLGWRVTFRSTLVVVALFVGGALVNASKLAPISAAAHALPPLEAVLRVVVGIGLMLFCAAIPEELVYRWGLQTRLERSWGRPLAIVATAVLFTAWHLPPRYFLASGAEGTAGDWRSVLLGTGLPVLLAALIFGWAWDRWRNLPALVALHWGVDALPSIASFLRLPPGGH
jgi:membrane protease YdiL (CAAX protease family)